MKRKLMMMALCAGFTTLAVAQTEDTREQFQVGVKAGINVSNIYDSEGEDFEADPHVGFVGGGFLSIPIGKYIGIQPEVLYSQKGIQQNGSFLGSDYTIRRTMGFLDIPLYLQIKPIPAVTFLVGPQYCFLLHRTDKFTLGEYSTTDEEQFRNDNIRKNVLGVAFGADLNISSFVIGVRGAWDLQNNNGDGTSSNPRYKMAWAQVTGGFKF